MYKTVSANAAISSLLDLCEHQRGVLDTLSVIIGLRLVLQDGRQTQIGAGERRRRIQGDLCVLPPPQGQ